MSGILQSWWRRQSSDPQIVLLFLLLAAGVALVSFAGDVLAPIFAGIVIAYVLDGAIGLLGRRGVPRAWALWLVYLSFIAAVLVAALKLGPILTQQATDFLSDLPRIAARGQAALMSLPERHPGFVSAEHIQSIIGGLKNEMAAVGHRLLSLSLSSVAGFISALIYLVLVPLLIFFFMKDKRAILAWFARFMPAREKQTLTRAVWAEVNRGISGYIRGKLIEILALWAASWIVFALFGLQYAPLLSFLVGLSVVVPYLGAAAVTVPIALVAYTQWGFSDQFIYVLAAYAVLQFLDGNVLVPLLFSEIVNLHPIAIICAVLVFGSIWGLWGVFFAIPLATLVNAVIKAWPRAADRAAR